jgi:hypothetical protein
LGVHFDRVLDLGNQQENFVDLLLIVFVDETSFQIKPHLMREENVHFASLKNEIRDFGILCFVKIATQVMRDDLWYVKLQVGPHFDRLSIRNNEFRIDSNILQNVDSIA